MEYRSVTADDIAQTDGLEDWNVIDGPAIVAEFIATDYLAGADLARTFAGLAEQHHHHPDLELRYPGRVKVLLTTHDTGGLSNHDVEMALRFSAAARESDASAVVD
jgi:4a-hydroxytetrahydrobiopterin dehydratase